MGNIQMNKIPYTSKQMQSRFIACTVLLSGKRPVLDCVRHATGPNENKPVLYNSIQEAQEDQFFDDQYDEVIPASEYFERVFSQANEVIKP